MTTSKRTSPSQELVFFLTGLSIFAFFGIIGGLIFLVDNSGKMQEFGKCKDFMRGTADFTCIGNYTNDQISQAYELYGKGSDMVWGDVAFVAFVPMRQLPMLIDMCRYVNGTPVIDFNHDDCDYLRGGIK